MISQLSKGLLVLGVATVVTGCGSASKDTDSGVLTDKSVDYRRETDVGRQLEIPPDLTRISGNEMNLPEATPSGPATYSDYAQKRDARRGAGIAGATDVLPNVESIEMRRDGNRRWHYIAAPPDQVWFKVVDFWQQNGILLLEQDPTTGVMRTAWLENRADIKSDFVNDAVRSVFDGCTPWPWSEEHFLVSYSPLGLVMEPGPQADNALGIYLLDAFGNRELIYRDPESGSISPIPLRARARPPVIPRTAAANAPVVGRILMSDVYRGLGNLERGTIKQLRIVQIFPKTTPWANKPPIGVAGEENPRAILGTVPVHEDGSAHFEVPAGKPILFQALDKDGFAYQTMRTITYVHPGEKVSCVGCHESRLSAPPSRPMLAEARPPSTIEPGSLGGTPFSYVRFVQPILDRNCVKCHGGEEPGKRKDPGIDEILTLAGDTRGDRRPGSGMELTSAKSGAFTASYAFLTKSVARVPRFPPRNQIQITEPGGKNGALGSALIRQLRDGHKGVRLTDAERRTLIAWIDLNAVFDGSCDATDNAREQRGEPIAMPAIQCACGGPGWPGPRLRQTTSTRPAAAAAAPARRRGTWRACRPGERPLPRPGASGP